MSSLMVLGAQETPSPELVVHYHRNDGDYQDWALYVWGTQLNLNRTVSWGQSLPPDARDAYGVLWRVPLKPSATRVSLILHAGETKNTKADVIVSIPTHGYEIWILENDPNIYSARPQIAGLTEIKPQQPPQPVPEPSSTPEPEPRRPQVQPARTAPSTENREPVLTKEIVTTMAQAMAQERELRDTIQALQKDNAGIQKALEESRKPRMKDILETYVLPAGLGILALAGWILVLLQKRRLSDIIKNREQEGLNLVKATEDRLLHKSLQDELTGLPNRAGFHQALTIALGKAKRYRNQIGLLFIDLDHFKPINDTLGHDAGDFVLKNIAGRFKECMRSCDTICRLGGDEFAVIVEDLADPRFLSGIAHKLLAAAQQGFVISGQEVHVSASIGIATYPQDGSDPQSLLKNSDSAMYKAKEAGKNTFHYYSQDQNTHALQRQALSLSLEHALERDEFSIVYQPVIHRETGEVQGLEALLRWSNKELGSLPPLQFLPLAEESGLLPRLNTWVLSTSLYQVRKWLMAGHRTSLAVNISLRSLYHENFVPELKGFLESIGFPPGNLSLEFSEEALMANPETAMDRLVDLKNLGVSLVLDNFGSGYGSLTNLRKFPIDGIKTDRSLMRGVPGDLENENLLATLISMGRNFGIPVTVCGVETQAQSELLKKLECTLTQGFYYSHPMASGEITELWKNRS